MATGAMRITDKSIVVKGKVTCLAGSAWRKWTTEAGLMSFMKRESRVELKPGGAYEIYFLEDNPVGLRGSEGCTVLSFIPGRMFSFTWNAPPHLRDARESGYHTWVVVDFESLAGGHTEVTITHLGFPEGPIWDEVHEYFTEAWQQVMGWLRESCRSDEPAS